MILLENAHEGNIWKRVKNIVVTLYNLISWNSNKLPNSHHRHSILGNISAHALERKNLLSWCQDIGSSEWKMKMQGHGHVVEKLASVERGRLPRSISISFSLAHHKYEQAQILWQQILWAKEEPEPEANERSPYSARTWSKCNPAMLYKWMTRFCHFQQTARSVKILSFLRRSVSWFWPPLTCVPHSLTIMTFTATSQPIHIPSTLALIDSSHGSTCLALSHCLPSHTTSTSSNIDEHTNKDMCIGLIN